MSICLGDVPETFTWEYYDKDKNHHKLGPITPIDFYNNHVKPVFNMLDKVSRTISIEDDTQPFLANIFGINGKLILKKDVSQIFRLHG